MTTLSTHHSPGHPASAGAAAARSANKHGAHGPAAGAGPEGGDAFADLMQSLAQQEAPEDGATVVAADDAGSTDPAASQAMAAAPGPDAAQLAPSPHLATALVAALGTEAADAAGLPAGDGAAGVATAGDAASAGGAAGSTRGAGRGADGAGRGLAWAQPGDGLPPAFAAAAQAGAGEARPPGLARQAAGGAGAGLQPPFAAAGLQAPGNRGMADATSLIAAPSTALAAQAAAALADEAGATPAGSPGAQGRTGSPAGLPAFDLSALAGPSALDAGAPAPVHQAELRAGPQDAAFAGELAAQVDVMVQGELQQAELRLNPVDLGPIRIELRMDGNTADVVFSAAHDATREGISRSLEQLRDMLASQGLNLGQAEVGARHAGQGHPDGSSAARPARAAAGRGDEAPVAAAAAPRPRALRGMLDLYA